MFWWEWNCWHCWWWSQCQHFAYIKRLEQVRAVLSNGWLQEAPMSGNWTLHRSKHSWLSNNIWDHITPHLWPLNSTDCKHVNYYVWAAVQRNTKKTPCKIRTNWNQWLWQHKETSQMCWRRIECRLDAVVKDSGDFIKQIYYLVFQGMFWNFIKYMLKRKCQCYFHFFLNLDKNLSIGPHVCVIILHIYIYICGFCHTMNVSKYTKHKYARVLQYFKTDYISIHICVHKVPWKSIETARRITFFLLFTEDEYKTRHVQYFTFYFLDFIC